MSELDYDLDGEEGDEYYDTCENCGNEITLAEFNNTGVTEYCYECSPDPRGQAFGSYDGEDE